MEQKYQSLIFEACADLIGDDANIELVRPDEKFGDFTTNVALQVANKKGENPRELAQKISDRLASKLEDVEKVEIAGPGFINLTLKDSALFSEAISAHKNTRRSLDGKTIVAEYSDPNPFKVLHAGHLYTSLVGDSIANLLESAGAKVVRVNFGGDVGLHVAKTMWAILKELGGKNPDKLGDIDQAQKLDWVSQRYVLGNNAYEDDGPAQEEIVDLNKKIYQIHADNDKSSPLARIYWTCRKWSYEGFEDLYGRLEMKPFDKYYPESDVAGRGLEAVKDGLKRGIFKESESAIVFDGDAIGLHTRVFINSEGLPTYEAKDLGLALTKWDEYHFDKSFIITGNDIDQYMKVVIAAAKHFNKEAAENTIHRTHGQIKLAGGEKMSSRKGNILRADDILDAARAAAEKAGRADEEVVLGAVRYSFLKNRIGGDIIYDPVESVSMEGNSGPYIQYALVRARSILNKAGEVQRSSPASELDEYERSLARAISKYPEIVEVSLGSYSPHHICTYLYELAQNFNRFYENSRVIDDPRSSTRVVLVDAYEKVLAHGLGILGMPTPEKM